jgi:hypothetical protein
MSYALDGKTGTTTIETKGTRYTITFKADQLLQEPIVEVAIDRSIVKNGTSITVRWPQTPRCELQLADSRILQIAGGYRTFNPHLTLQVTVDGIPPTLLMASDPAWRHWRAPDPAPAHWYDQPALERLIAAHVRHDQDHARGTSVREFISHFRGLTGSVKQKSVTSAVDVSRTSLAEFFGRGDAVNKGAVACLLDAMKAETRPVKATDLGVIGEDHLRQRLADVGADSATIRYKRVTSDLGMHPFVVEAAFGYCGECEERQLAIGLNFSPAIGNPIRELEECLSDCWVDSDHPVVIALHITCPRFSFTDRGKGSIVTPPAMDAAISDAVRLVTKEWTKQSRAEHKDTSARARRIERMTVCRKVHFTDAANDVMERAYMEASANGTLPATATQIMYAARGEIQNATGKRLNRQYFNQTLLPSYMADNPETTSTWDVTYDDRGQFVDPHTEQMFGLGTEAVRKYLARVGDPEFCGPELQPSRVETNGPQGCYGALLYIEKEGFLDILNHVLLAKRYDIAIMSCKGTSVTAARRLADKLCHRHQIPLFVLHDFDKAGFSILGTLRRDTRRYAFENDIQVNDLGLRLADVERLGLADRAEDVSDKGGSEKRAANMRRNGATEAEIEFLLRQRVEPNALPSDRLIRFIEDKLTEHGVAKVVPDVPQLEDAYCLFVRGKHQEQIIKRELAGAETIPVDIPDDLSELVRKHLESNPAVRWDEAVRRIVEGTAP